MSLHYNTDNGCLFVSGKKIFKFKADNPGSISNGCNAAESREVSLKSKFVWFFSRLQFYW